MSERFAAPGASSSARPPASRCQTPGSLLPTFARASGSAQLIAHPCLPPIERLSLRCTSPVHLHPPKPSSRDSTSMPRTKEGYRHDNRNGLSSGFETDAAIEPRKRVVGQKDRFDVVVVGAGYAGLIAARDLAYTGTTAPCISAFLYPASDCCGACDDCRAECVAGRGARPDRRSHLDGERGRAQV